MHFFLDILSILGLVWAALVAVTLLLGTSKESRGVRVASVGLAFIVATLALHTLGVF